jgi:YidC/Oxa1 family membrane protein insertase
LDCKDTHMTDIRRTLLWVVFTMSLVLLWDGWNKHTGAPSIFSGTTARPVSASACRGLERSPRGSNRPAATAGPSRKFTARRRSRRPVCRRRVSRRWRAADHHHDRPVQGHDRFARWRSGRRSFDITTRSIVANIVLLDRSRTCARHGLATVDVCYPNHETPMAATAKARTDAGRRCIELRLDSPEVSGVRLREPTFRRGDYCIGVSTN